MGQMEISVKVVRAIWKIIEKWKIQRKQKAEKSLTLSSGGVWSISIAISIGVSNFSAIFQFGQWELNRIGMSNQIVFSLKWNVAERMWIVSKLK